MKNIVPSATGKIAVPLDHFANRHETLDLYFERYCFGSNLKDPLVFLHGGPGNAVSLDQTFFQSEVGKHLLGEFDILYFHQRGSGKSESQYDKSKDVIKNFTHCFSAAQYVKDIDLVCDSVFGSNTKVNVIGSSWGGYLGLCYGLERQDRVRSMILGSFEISGMSMNLAPLSIDFAIAQACVEVPLLNQKLRELVGRIGKADYIWKIGTASSRTVLISDLFEIVSPFLAKAKYQELLNQVERLIAGDQSTWDLLQLKEEGSVDAGASFGGEVTFCQSFINPQEFRAASKMNFCGLWGPSSGFYNSILESYDFYFPNGHETFDFSKIEELSVPCFGFAGSKDPIVPWQMTERVVSKMKFGRFHLIDGGHSPFREGGQEFSEKVLGFLKSQ